MVTSPRCGARPRDGTACRAPAMHGKRRCRMHGGARGSGPEGQPDRLEAWIAHKSGEFVYCLMERGSCYAA
ncbi:HGGxSTG domain-containing protein [Bradyrhizobium sp. DASA03068]|uniref:HGGxSTG domain-containing protein n=1 Tax=Bradyrhizobium sp. BLXBL-01 TaxID=3395915 RepID=UPI003F726EFA